MKGSGGTNGGVGEFTIGFLMAGVAAYLFFDSVRVVTEGTGMISGMLRGRGGQGGAMETTSMGILFVPFFLGVFSLFVNSKQRWAWVLTYLGMGVIVVEILSRIRFYINTKLTLLSLMIILFAAGCAFMFRSYRDLEETGDDDPGAPPNQPGNA